MMVQNIKTDIIYYKTATDFELEFSICGCCRMRLLTDKVTDTKNLIPSMARAVSRSRIILIIGNLFGDDGIISLAAKAIGKNLEIINNSDFGISDNSEIKIISGSTPLVSPQGIFGGCIIESGPQTLVLLTESKSIRKSIMNSLIYPYVTELASQLYKESAKKEQAAPVEASPAEAEPVLEQAPEDFVDDEISDESTETTESTEDFAEAIVEPTNDIIQDQETSEEQIQALDETIEAYEEPIEPQSSENNGDIVFADIEYPEDDDQEIPYDSGYSAKPYKKVSSSNIFMLITAILLFVSIAVFCYAVLFVPAQNGISPSDYIREIFSTLFV